jgi:hypothetical protein
MKNTERLRIVKAHYGGYTATLQHVLEHCGVYPECTPPLAIMYDHNLKYKIARDQYRRTYRTAVKVLCIDPESPNKALEHHGYNVRVSCMYYVYNHTIKYVVFRRLRLHEML